MTVGFVLDDTLDVTDGVQQAVLTTGEEMTRRGHDVHYIVAATHRHEDLQIHSIASFIELKFNGNSVRTPRGASKKTIQELYDSLSFDVLYVQMPFSPFLSGRVISLAPKKTKIFGTFHILPYTNMSRIGTRLLGVALKKSLKRFDGFFAVSEPALTFMESVFKVSGNVLPNPIDYDQYHIKHKKSQSHSVVFVGRFDERKGALQLVNAISLLPKKLQQETKFILCGKGPLLEEAKQLSEANGTNIQFPGFVSRSEKIDYLANATIAVFPSISGESFGIVLAEAMSAGADVTIGGNNPGYESVIGRWPETLFKGRDPVAIAAIVTEFLNNKKLRNSIGKEQHLHVKTYDVKQIVDEMEKQYSCSIEHKKR